MIDKLSKPKPLKIKADELKQLFGEFARVTLGVDKIIIELDKVKLKLENK